MVGEGGGRGGGGGSGGWLLCNLHTRALTAVHRHYSHHPPPLTNTPHLPPPPHLILARVSLFADVAQVAQVASLSGLNHEMTSCGPASHQGFVHPTPPPTGIGWLGTFWEVCSVCSTDGIMLSCSEPDTGKQPIKSRYISSVLLSEISCWWCFSNWGQ